MTTQEHALNATRTLPDLGSAELNLSHMALGLAGELGEIVNCTGTELKIKIDNTNLKEELGDIYWYLSNYCNLREVPIPDSNSLKIQLPTESLAQRRQFPRYRWYSQKPAVTGKLSEWIRFHSLGPV